MRLSFVRIIVPLALIASITALWSYAAAAQRHWQANVDRLISTLITTPSPPCPTTVQSWEDLPLVVKRYLTRLFTSEVDLPALAEPHPHRIHSVHLKQVGFFQQDPKSAWLPFTADQVATTTGFVWHAVVSLVPNSHNNLQLDGRLGKSVYRLRRWVRDGLQRSLTMSVIDSMVESKGSLQVAMWHGAVPVVDSQDLPQDVLYQGEALRWLAEATLIPTVLLPESGLVRWKAAGKANQAILELVGTASGPTLALTATFDDDGYLTRIEGSRAAIRSADDIIDRPWIGILGDYRWIAGMWVPAHMEAGWRDETKEEEAIDFYFRGDNKEFDFVFAEDQACVAES